MARLLFRLAQVPEDEAQDIRALLSEHEIAFYETDAGFWRVGLDAIWLADNAQEAQARELIQHYQQQRSARHQQNLIALAEQGIAPGFWQQFGTQPVRSLALLLAIIFVLGLTLIPFVMLLHMRP